MQTTSSQIKHTLNTIYVLLDVLISGGPIRIVHFVYTVLLGSVYAVFNAIYFLNDGTILEGRHYAYNVLDWGEPTKAIMTCALCVILCIFAEVLLYTFYRIREWIYTKLYFGSDGCKSDAEMQKIMQEPEGPAYQTISEAQIGQDNECHQTE